MAQKLYKAFRITGQANAEVQDEGIVSTEPEPKRILELIVNVSGYADNTVKAYVERKEMLSVPDYLLDTDADTGTANTLYSTTKLNRFEINLELPIGQKFYAAHLCGPTATNLRGVYVYEIM